MTAPIDDLRSPTRIHEALEALGQGPKKSLGQNFLFDQPLLQAFVSDLRLTGAESVLEIGPGLGHFTREILLKSPRVIVVEKDRVLAGSLAERLGDPDHLTVIEGDALELSGEAILAKSEGRELVMAGNLPYYCSSPILGRLFEEWGGLWKRAGFLLQEELVDRIVATPGSKEYGRLSVLVQAFSNARKTRTARPHLFVPKPEVTSAWVVLEPTSPMPPITAGKLSHLTSVAFGTRRKTLMNNLAREWGKPQSADWIACLGLAPSVRPEKVSVADFLRLAGLTNSPG